MCDTRIDVKCKVRAIQIGAATPTEATTEATTEAATEAATEVAGTPIATLNWPLANFNQHVPKL